MAKSFLKIGTKVRINPGWQKMAAKEALEVMPALMDQGVAVSKSRSPVQFGINKNSIKWIKLNPKLFKLHTESGYGGWLHIGYRAWGRKQIPARPYILNGFHWLAKRLRTVKNKEELNQPLGDPGRPMRVDDRPLAKAV